MKVLPFTEKELLETVYGIGPKILDELRRLFASYGLRCATKEEVKGGLVGFTNNDGGPAFPVIGAEQMLGNPSVCSGMSLRDYFAAAAEASGNCPHNQHDHTDCAKWAFARADIMLALRDRT